MTGVWELAARKEGATFGVAGTGADLKRVAMKCWRSFEQLWWCRIVRDVGLIQTSGGVSGIGYGAANGYWRLASGKRQALST